MNIFQKGIKKLLGDRTEVPKNDELFVLANGKILDKRLVEDPTGKFFGTRFVSQQESINKIRRNVQFSKPEYDLATIANAIQMDGILQRYVNIFVEQILKNGYDFVSRNDRAQKYIQKRINEIQYLTGIPFYEIMNLISYQLVSYANAYVIKVRSSTKSNFAKRYRLYNREFDPIVGLFVVDAATMQIGVNENGQIVNYKQVINGSEYYWDEMDVIHITYNRIPGTLTGMSPIITVLDDVRALRKLEEEIEILGFQYSIPLYLYKVGTKDIPPGAGEIDQVRDTINSMPAYGMLVVPGHHSIEVPTNNNTPVDLVSFINHFKHRIYSGLGVSPIAMGESSTSNRNTSEVMDVSMQTITKRFQQTIKNKLEMDLFRELLLDGGFNIYIDKIEFTFPEIDLESQIKKETNIIQKWQNNLITRDEARLELDYEKSIIEENTFLHLVELPKIAARQSINVTADDTDKRKREIDNMVAPENQHGKLTGRPKFVKDEIFFKNFINSSTSKVILMLQDDGNKSKLNIVTLTNKLTDTLSKAIRRYIYDTVSELCSYHRVPSNNVIDDAILKNYIDSANFILSNKLKVVSSKLDSNIEVELFSHDIKDFLELQKHKSENLAKLLVYKSLGFPTILVDAGQCEYHVGTNINLEQIIYSNIPPYRYNCRCIINEKGLYEFNEVDTKINSN